LIAHGVFLMASFIAEWVFKNQFGNNTEFIVFLMFIDNKASENRGFVSFN